MHFQELRKLTYAFGKSHDELVTACQRGTKTLHAFGVVSVSLDVQDFTDFVIGACMKCVSTPNAPDPDPDPDPILNTVDPFHGV